ncbi:MAG: LTA synthase family protein, partial [Bacteroidota bacterium]|nr:LTA synthase family protein [Bacteroidota bacterium]
MTRQGLGSTGASLADTNNVAEVQSSELEILFTAVTETKKQSRLLSGLREAAVYSLVLLISMLVVKIYEFVRDIQKFGVPKEFSKVIEFGIINDISFVLNIAIIPVSIFLLLYCINKKFARVFFVIFSLFLIIIHAALAEYFLETLVPLGADLLGYSLADIKQTVGAAGISMTFVFGIVLILAFIILLFITIPKKLQAGPRLSIAAFGLFVLAAICSVSAITYRWRPGEEFSNNISLNKSYYFYKNCYAALYSNNKINVDNDEAVTANSFHYVDEEHFPFLHTVDSTDVLSPFFNKSTKQPNLVFIVVEGLGRAFSNNDAYLGSFTPFLDSLSGKSLYWSNFLSSGGRTFAMLPSIFGSLPFSKNGFLELGNDMPKHASLLSVLKNNGYVTNFFYGGDASFDNMNLFLKMNGTNVYDEKTFTSNYAKMPLSNNGFTWGYGDEEVLRKCNEVNAAIDKPSCNVIMTLSTHSPFLISEQDKYLALFEQRMNELQFTDAQKQEHRRYQDQYATILYADNAIRNFINEYKSLPDFANTIFVVTGDHRMPEIPMSTK